MTNAIFNVRPDRKYATEIYEDLRRDLPFLPVFRQKKGLLFQINALPSNVGKTFLAPSGLSQILFHGRFERMTPALERVWNDFKDVVGFAHYGITDETLFLPDREQRRNLINTAVRGAPFNVLWHMAIQDESDRESELPRIEVLRQDAEDNSFKSLMVDAEFDDAEDIIEPEKRLHIGGRGGIAFHMPFEQGFMTIIYQSPLAVDFSPEMRNPNPQFRTACLNQMLHLQDRPLARDRHEIGLSGQFSPPVGPRKVIGIASREPITIAGWDPKKFLSRDQLVGLMQSVFHLGYEDTRLATFQFHLTN